jgi:cytochrome b pre-mRNA-processing protein 3
MPARSILIRSLRTTPHSIFTHAVRSRYLTTANSPVEPGSPLTNPPSPTKSQSWLTRKVKSSPTALKIFLKVAKALGYGSPQQVTARRALALYRELCTVRADEESAFWTTGEFHLRSCFTKDHFPSTSWPQWATTIDRNITLKSTILPAIIKE